MSGVVRSSPLRRPLVVSSRVGRAAPVVAHLAAGLPVALDVFLSEELVGVLGHWVTLPGLPGPYAGAHDASQVGCARGLRGGRSRIGGAQLPGDPAIPSLARPAARGSGARPSATPSLVKRDSAARAMRAFKADYRRDATVRAECHDLTHVIGRAAGKRYRDVARAYRDGDRFCGSGYFHGVVEEIVGESGGRRRPGRRVRRAARAQAALGRPLQLRPRPRARLHARARRRRPRPRCATATA